MVPLQWCTNCMKAMFIERQVSYSGCKEKIKSFRGQASLAKMALPGGKLMTLACLLTEKVNKAGQHTYLSINIE
jgi:hypothetical protein